MPLHRECRDLVGAKVPLDDKIPALGDDGWYEVDLSFGLLSRLNFTVAVCWKAFLISVGISLWYLVSGGYQV